MTGYHERRLGRFADVPVARGSIGAMGLSGPTDTFRLYVYRGVGEDVLTPNFETPEEIADRQAKEAEALAKARDKRAEEARIKRIEAERRAAERKAERERDAARRKTKRRVEHNGWKVPAEFLETTLESTAVTESRLAQAAAEMYPPRVSKPRPSPGWKPMTGADLEDLFAELNDD